MAIFRRDGSRLRPSAGLYGLLAPLLAGLIVITGGHARGQIVDEPASTPAEMLELGHSIAARDCSTCHAVELTGNSPLPEAPRFRDLHEQFDVGDLSEALAEGIVVGHGAMPVWVYEPDEVQALVGYLKSLEPASKSGN